jgi:hypothetical protein
MTLDECKNCKNWIYKEGDKPWIHIKTLSEWCWLRASPSGKYKIE